MPNTRCDRLVLVAGNHDRGMILDALHFVDDFEAEGGFHFHHGHQPVEALTAAEGIQATRAGRSVEYGREVVRDNPLGINEGATGDAQLWVIVSQIRQELTLAPKADVLVLGTVARNLKSLLMGNTADTVLRQITCSVLTVKPAGFASPVLKQAAVG